MIEHKEFWKSIIGYNYEVSNCGRVRSISRPGTKGGVLKTRLNNWGYVQVGLCREGKHKWFYMQRLVAIAFIPNPNNLPQVNHKDENKQNNFVWVNEDGSVDLEKSNLEWVSVEANNIFANRLKRTSETNKLNNKRGKRVGQYTLDGTLVAIYPSSREAARQTGFKQSSISICCIGKRKTAYGYIWKYID